ncbi:MAG: DUF368 domain-containing protein [Bacteroidetes bacterium MedPE-SWsnd-G2]|nr:MAG: DUF368 domain-containing protein [Bacteroidetes bacterium MedPE-SWsnd-G2]
MQRRFSDYIVIALKGIAMGAADAVPGVSGGTIALISGIYQELITTISNVNLALFKTLKEEGFAAFWKQANGNFLLALLSGILVSYVTFMKIASYLIEHEPILIWSFFFGLIVASIYYVGKEVKSWNIKTIACFLIGALLAYFITTLPSMGDNENPWFLFVAGAIAICAMILPGISGSFILVILGAYTTLSTAINTTDIKSIAIFGTGATIGLLSFSKLLKWLFKHYSDITLAVLTGFILGSLNKVWPWKETISWRINSKGVKVPLQDISISPFDFPGDAQIGLAIGLMIFGFLTIFILERIGSKKA